MYTCRSLLRKKLIKKFKLINGDEAGVNVVFPDGGEAFLEYSQCVALSEGSLASSGGGVVAPSMN